jgi:arylsulfatase A-like enzyme
MTLLPRSFVVRPFLALIAICVALVAAPLARADGPAKRPNVVIILADDLGYGDVGCYGAKSVKTTNVDRVAREGLRFTDAHTSASTCTPSRYSLLTGAYAWRKKGTNILPGDANLIISPGTTTVASLLKAAGYRTGVVGKWHLGLGAGPIDWNREIKPGPREIGFDYSFLIPATGDRVPCVYVENQRVVGLDPKDPIRVSYQQKVGDEPTGKEHPELLTMKPSRGHDQTIVNGISRIGTMAGGKAARWNDEDMADTITKKAVRFIEQNREKPFFLYFATHDVHVPRVPHPRFVGKTDMGPRGDAIVQFDACVGAILAVLDRLQLADDTIVILTSDNGPVVDDGYQDGAVARLGAHRPAGRWRGGKYSTFEGGHRVPFIVRWPKHVRPGTSDALVCQVDLLASLAALTGQKLDAAAGPDSLNVLPALTGEAKTGRDELVLNGNGLRQGSWVLIEAARGKKKAAAAPVQLFDLTSDPGQMTNLAAREPERVARMTAVLQRIRSEGRSRR